MKSFEGLTQQGREERSSFRFFIQAKLLEDCLIEFKFELPTPNTKNITSYRAVWCYSTKGAQLKLLTPEETFNSVPLTSV
ncbi:hypothetical protein VNO78_18219 [Psophocarpus tetragonolobus]|uniref:Uncharacterized protein n=1 Tax=Psophocarpus tetragonolobus TaxID=3891 RepID=A0AAN9SPI4_PSOTE